MYRKIIGTGDYFLVEFFFESVRCDVILGTTIGPFMKVLTFFEFLNYFRILYVAVI